MSGRPAKQFRRNKMNLQDAISKYDGLVEQRNALAGQEVTDEVRAQIAELDKQVDAAEAEVRSAQHRMEQDKVVAEARKLAGSVTVTESRGQSDNDALKLAIRSGNFTEFTVPVINGAGGFNELRANNVGTAGANYTNGAFGEAVARTIAGSVGLFKAGATVLTTTSGENISAYGLAPFDVAATSPAGAIPETTVGADKVLGATSYKGIANFARELVDDSSTDLVGVAARNAGTQIAKAVSSAVLTKVLTNSTLGATASDDATISAADIYALYYALEEHAGNGTWLMHPTTASALRTSASNLWSVDPASDNPNLLLGRPVIVDSGMPVVGASNKSVLFGDFAGVVIRQVRGLRVETSGDYKFGNDVISLRVVWRGDGVLAADTVRHLIHPAS
jgi:HK97 family phage major capsid protein